MRDDLITLLIAGHETTAAVLTWLVYALSQHPECLKVVPSPSPSPSPNPNPNPNPKPSPSSSPSPSPNPNPNPNPNQVVQKEIDEVVGDRYPTIEDIKVMPEVPHPAPKCPGSQSPPLRDPPPAASSGPIRSLRASPLGPRGAPAAAGRPEARGKGAGGWGGREG